MSEKELIRKWIETWRLAGPEFEAIRRRELEEMTDAQACEAALDLLRFPMPPDLPPRTGSGLIEQQRWFAKLRQKA